MEHTTTRKVSQPRGILEIKLGFLILFVVIKQVFLKGKMEIMKTQKVVFLLKLMAYFYTLDVLISNSNSL